MTIVNFIAKTETMYKTRGIEIISSDINSQYGKISRITYNLPKPEIETFNRKCSIILELFTVMRTSAEGFYLSDFDDSYSSSGYVTHEKYTEREFDFETMVPTGHSHILNFRYQDTVGFQFYTAINKNTNRIYETGFIDRGLLSKTPGMVIDTIDTQYDQFQLFLQSNFQ
jgi:hypothetical protein